MCREACSDADRLAHPLEPALGSAPSVAAHAVGPARAAGWAVDTFLHTWDPAHNATLVEHLRPAAASFGAFRGADGAVAPQLGRYVLRVGDVEAPALLSVQVVA